MPNWKFGGSAEVGAVLVVPTVVFPGAVTLLNVTKAGAGTRCPIAHYAPLSILFIVLPHHDLYLKRHILRLRAFLSTHC